ncbi:disease resistance protein RUN1-like [Gossypium raimondii]|uniref:disease resistance protein RUN1-like n=1 Tax=Gossypium raimondii TaxID=29730 RepID=UPI00227A010B|nr:disease resistance protein RUN1-like [Gossypium raimondii]
MLNLSVDAFSKMKKLRLLKVLCLLNCDDLKFLSNELRLLDWKGCPLRSLPSSFQPDNLVALLLSYSRIQQLWKGNRPLCKLKMMNLEGSQNLIKTPDFTTASNLEVLILKGCTKLVDIHPSIAVLKSLQVLNLRDCKSLRSLPIKIGMESLETLILSGCSSLVRFPEIDGKMERLKTLDLSGCYRVENLLENLQQAKFLEELDLSETAITKPPSFICQFKNLKVLSFNGFKRGRMNSMAPMLPSLSGLSSLRELNLRDCNLGEGDIPSDISGLSSLEELDLSGNNFTSIPASLTRLSKLEELKLSNCNMCALGEADIHGLSSLRHLYLRGNNFITIPLALTQLSRLQLLALSNCMKLKSLPELLTSIKNVWIDGCSSLEVVASPSKVCNLVDSAAVKAFNCFKLAENINALTLLKKHLKAFANSIKRFDIIMPGSEIPEWFSQQKSDSLIKIPLRKDSQWIGVASCCIFVNNDASRDAGFIDCRALMYGRNHRRIEGGGYLVGKRLNEPIMKDHLFLHYWSRDKLYPFSLEDKYGDCETNNLRATGLDHKCDGLCVFFNGHSLKVKKCGVRIVYEKDLEEIEELQCHITQSSPDFEHIHQHSAQNDGSPLCKLKMISLGGSQNLIKTRNFTTASNLEVLVLKGCTKLVDIHPSIAVLKSLKVLNLRDCKSLRTLPTKIGMESLEALILWGCSSLVRFSEIDRKMERLKTLDLSGCYRVETLLENLQQAKFLEELDLRETAITELPSFIFQFKNLKVLSFNECKGPSYKLLPNLPSFFKVIQGRRTNPMARMLPLLSGLSSLRVLRVLKLKDCNLCEGDIPPYIFGLSFLE